MMRQFFGFQRTPYRLDSYFSDVTDTRFLRIFVPKVNLLNYF